MDTQELPEIDRMETEDLLEEVRKALMARQEEIGGSLGDLARSDQARSDQAMRWGRLASTTVANLDWLLRGDPTSYPDIRGLIDVLFFGEELAKERGETITKVYRERKATQSESE